MTAAAAEDRAEALRALSLAAQAWCGLCTVDGDGATAAIAETLLGVFDAVQDGDVEALAAKGGPRRWARARLGQQRAFPRRAAVAGNFEAWCQLRLGTLRGNDAADPWAALRREPEANQLAGDALIWLTFMGRKSELVPRPPKPPREIAVTMAAQIRRLARREPEGMTAQALAIRLLRGWGLSLQQARDAMKCD